MTIKKDKTKKIELNSKFFVNNSIINTKFGNEKDAELLVYFVDKNGLEKHWFKKKDDVSNQIKYEKFDATNNKIISLGFIKNKQVALVGIDKDDKKDNNNAKKQDENLNLLFAKAGAKIVSILPKGQKVNILLSNKYIENKKLKDDKFLVEAYFGFNQRNYKFDKYLTNEEEQEKKTTVEKIILDIKETAELKQLIKKRQNQLEGIFYVRTLGNEPSNVIYPETFVAEIKKAFAGVKNIKINVLDKKELIKLGMNMLLGVAQGSVKEPKVIVVEYLGNSKKKSIDLALVGKGVTFDSGGLSLKPSPYMEGMKCDMLGATTVVSSLLSIAKNNLKVNVVAVAGMVENMPDGNAQKVGDIVKSMSGKTVEIIDTDAEGRLVLGDILYYAQSKYKPDCMIDMATLTGAIMVALGTEKAGIFSNNDEFAEKIKKSGEKTGDRCWVMPLGEEYHESIKSQIADIRNLGKNRYGGSATAAAFLENFIDDNKKWAHIDIAGVDTATSNNAFSQPDFVSGFGVKLLNDFVEEYIEK